MLSCVREDADDGFAQDGAEAARGVECVLDETVAAVPAPFAHEGLGGFGFVEFDADDEGDVLVGLLGRRGCCEERLHRGTVLDGTSGEDVCVGVEAAVVSEQEVSEEICAEDVDGVGCIEVLEVGDGEEDVIDEGVCHVGGDELGVITVSFSFSLFHPGVN